MRQLAFLNPGRFPPSAQLALVVTVNLSCHVMFGPDDYLKF